MFQKLGTKGTNMHMKRQILLRSEQVWCALFSVINIFTVNGTILHNGCTIKVQMVFSCIMKNGIMGSNPEID
jgi:hypothetical protein